MLLIGQFDSPFVRRVGVALHLYDLPFEHRPWSVFRDAEQISAYNPLRRVPTLVLDDGTALVESAAILDALDDLVAPARALVPRSGAARRDVLRVCALASGLADKAVSLVYERALRDQPSAVWVERCTRQMGGALALLDGERAARATPWWFGAEPTHADIAIGCVVAFLREAHPALDLPAPALEAALASCEALPAFRQVYQPFVVTP